MHATRDNLPPWGDCFVEACGIWREQRDKCAAAKLWKKGLEFIDKLSEQRKLQVSSRGKTKQETTSSQGKKEEEDLAD